MKTYAITSAAGRFVGFKTLHAGQVRILVRAGWKCAVVAPPR